MTQYSGEQRSPAFLSLVKSAYKPRSRGPRSFSCQFPEAQPWHPRTAGTGVQIVKTTTVWNTHLTVMHNNKFSYLCPRLKITGPQYVWAKQQPQQQQQQHYAQPTNQYAATQQSVLPFGHPRDSAWHRGLDSNQSYMPRG